MTATASIVDEVLAELRSLGSEENIAGMARYGIVTDRALGVSMPALQAIAKRLGRDHALALALWHTDVHEARILALLVAEPKKMTPEGMDAWAADLDSWDLCDQACMKLFIKTPYVNDKIRAWAEDEREYVRRTAFSLMAVQAGQDKRAPDAAFLPWFEIIERHARDPRNFVKKGVNWALRKIGMRSPSLHEAALALAEKLAADDDRTARWIGRAVVKELSDPARIVRIAERAKKRGSNA